MSATDELRTWAAERVPIVRRQIEKIADNIDAEFERVAQAVEATLGRVDTYTREDMVSFVSGTTDIPVHERIVRCRDCRWFDSRPNHQLCRRDMSCDEIAVCAEPDGFCAWGERREVNE